MSLLSRLKVALVSSLFVVPFMTATVSAQNRNTSLDCSVPDIIIEVDEQEVCDLAIQKQVKVNGGSFVDANDVAGAANARVGDNITWQITVTNTSNLGLMPRDVVYVHDVLPAGLTFESSTASNGSGAYDELSNTWIIDTENDLPATLTIVTTATTIGTITNTAAIAEIDYCGDGCIDDFSDDNSANNSDDAVVVVSSLPQVLGSSTTATPAVLAATGSNFIASILAGTLTVTAVAVVVIARRRSTIKG